VAKRDEDLGELDRLVEGKKDNFANFKDERVYAETELTIAQRERDETLEKNKI
jgi:hypothetical protein